MALALPPLPEGTGYSQDYTEEMNRQSRMRREDERYRQRIAEYANLADEHIKSLQRAHPTMPDLKQEFPSTSDTIANIYYDISHHGDPVHTAPPIPDSVQIVAESWLIEVGQRPKHIAGGKRMFIKNALKYKVNGKKTFFFLPYQGVPVVYSPQSEGTRINYRGHELIQGRYRLLLPSEFRKRIGIR